MTDERQDRTGDPAPPGSSDPIIAGAWRLAEEELLAGPMPPPLPPLDAFPGYKVVRRIGAGGMGVVYEAWEESVQRLVALKVIGDGSHIDERRYSLFEREIHAQARLNDPAIATLYHPGRARGGGPFYTMELVDGEPVTHYARDAGLSLRQKLQLFGRVCRGVYHAHMKAVIHRDLKPGNILVDQSGAPKILDFGLARILEGDEPDRTLTRGPFGTREYMSPEQARGETDLDVRTDVYSLGVMLYELTTGQRPYDVTRLSWPAALKTIIEAAPPKPSSINPALRGDLEIIIDGALRKDASERYQSALALAEDIESYLGDRPISRRPPTAAYQVRKFVTRHKLPVTFAATVLVMILGSSLGMGVLYGDARRSAREAMLVENALVAEHASVDPELAKGRDTTIVRGMLRVGRDRAEAMRVDHPKAAARILATVANTYRLLGEFEQAESLYQEALEVEKGLYGEVHAEVAKQRMGLGDVYSDKGDYVRAEECYSQARQVWRALEGDRHPEAANCLRKMAWLYQLRSHFVQARELFKQALAVREELFGAEHRDVAESLCDLGKLQYVRGDLGGAERFYQRALHIHEKEPPTGDGALALAENLDGLAQVFAAKGDLDGAEALILRAEGLRREVLREGHWRVIQSRCALAALRFQAGQKDEAEALYREALSGLTAILGADHRLVADVRRALAKVRWEEAGFARSECDLPVLIDERRALLGDDAEEITYMQVDLALGLMREGSPDSLAEAEGILREVAARRQRTRPEPDKDWLTASARSILGECLTRLGRYEEAEPLLLEAFAVLSTSGDLDRADARIMRACRRVVELYRAWGQPEKAAEYEQSCPPSPGTPWDI